MPAPTLAERHQINELMRAVRSYTHPVIFNKNGCLGTAVCLRSGERLFAFTAAHNVKDDTTIHVRLNSACEQTWFKVLSDYIHPKYSPDPFSGTSKFDLAILELEPTPAVTAGDIEQLYTGEFAKQPQADRKVVSTAYYWVVGYPSELVNPSEKPLTLKQTAFATQILEYSADEFSLHYPTTGYQMPHDGTTCEVGETTKTPSGYSGGGVWATLDPPEVLFNPQRHIKLVGIETHWSERQRLARCVPGKVIAEALKEFKPDL